MASRFLEEMELPPTQAVASEMVRAARGDESSKLVEVCQSLSAFHNMVGAIQAYANKLPELFRGNLAKVELSAAERPFAYKQEYSNPNSRGSSQTNSTGGTNFPATVWDHINFGRI